jgi:hypothetical protein
MKLTAPLIGTITKSGMEGGDGTIFLVLAGAVALLAAKLWRGPLSHAMATRVRMVVLTIALMGLTAFEVSDISSRFADATQSSDLIVTSYGAGIWLVGLGTAAIAYAWLRPPWASLRRRAARPQRSSAQLHPR